MKVFYSYTENLAPSQAICPALSPQKGSAFGISLLSYAVREDYGLSLPKIKRAENGKPFFPENPEIHFSISHSGHHAACALSDSPVGIDIQEHRPVSGGFFEKISSPREREDFSLFELWTLRESYYKLTGEGSLRHTPFYISGNRIISPNPQVKCALYRCIENATLALCSYSESMPETLLNIPGTKLIYP